MFIMSDPKPLIYFSYGNEGYTIYFSKGIRLSEVEELVNVDDVLDECTFCDCVFWAFSNYKDSKEVFIRCLMLGWGFQGPSPQACAQVAYDSRVSFFLVKQ